MSGLSPPHALAEFGDETDRNQALEVLIGLSDITVNGLYVALAALNAIDALGPKADGVRGRVRTLPKTAPGVPQRLGEYVPRLEEITRRRRLRPHG